MEWDHFDDSDDIKKQVYGQFNRKDHGSSTKIEKQIDKKDKGTLKTNPLENDQIDSQNMYMVTSKPKGTERTWRLFAKAHQHYFKDDSS